MITLINPVILSESRSFARAKDLLKSKDPRARLHHHSPRREFSRVFVN